MIRQDERLQASLLGMNVLSSAPSSRKKKRREGEGREQCCSELIGIKCSCMQPTLASFLECVMLTLTSQPPVLCLSSEAQPTSLMPLPLPPFPAPLHTRTGPRSLPDCGPVWQFNQEHGKALVRGRTETL